MQTWTGVAIVCVLAAASGIYRGLQDVFGSNIIRGIRDYRKEWRDYQKRKREWETSTTAPDCPQDTDDKWKTPGRR